MFLFSTKYIQQFFYSHLFLQYVASASERCFIIIFHCENKSIIQKNCRITKYDNHVEVKKVERNNWYKSKVYIVNSALLLLDPTSSALKQRQPRLKQAMHLIIFWMYVFHFPISFVMRNIFFLSPYFLSFKTKMNKYQWTKKISQLNITGETIVFAHFMLVHLLVLFFFYIIKYSCIGCIERVYKHCLLYLYSMVFSVYLVHFGRLYRMHVQHESCTMH